MAEKTRVINGGRVRSREGKEDNYGRESIKKICKM